MTERLDCAVIGGGVVGLAVARALALRGREVVVLEAAAAVGTVTSARNSEVIHAGLYYPPGSLKAELCVAGNRRLVEYCRSHGVEYRLVGKLVVATDATEESRLDGLQATAEANGVPLEWLSGAEACALEPALRCTRALLSPTTGIVDSHGLMLALRGDAEAHGAAVAVNAPVRSGSAGPDGILLRVGGAEPSDLLCRRVVNCAGFDAQVLSAAIDGVPSGAIPPRHLCKGNYFALSGATPFRRLVYPVPVSAGLGIHFTLDLGGQGRFGPDVEWIDDVDYTVDPGRAASFATAIRRYWPGLPDGTLQPAYAGIRPKVQAPGEAAHDFIISGPADHGVAGFVALYGIESPGLTACLTLADRVADLLP
jgi:L-2-hydroxyglutarate oxidase LhgO